MLSHGNIIHNCSMITRAFESGRDANGFSWLPTYHDMGLIGGILNPTVLWPPLRSDVSNAVSSESRFAGCGLSPNFESPSPAARTLLTTCAPTRSAMTTLHGLDLSSWSLAFNGAEPVRRQTLERFYHRFAPFGLRRESFYPCYGMAETTLFVTGGLQAETTGRAVLSTARHSMRAVRYWRHRTAIEGRYSISCGRPLNSDEVTIVDPDTCTRLA